MQGRPDKLTSITDVNAKIAQYKLQKSAIKAQQQQYLMAISQINRRLDQLLERRTELEYEEKCRAQEAKKTKREKQSSHLDARALMLIDSRAASDEVEAKTAKQPRSYLGARAEMIIERRGYLFEDESGNKKLKTSKQTTIGHFFKPRSQQTQVDKSAPKTGCMLKK